LTGRSGGSLKLSWRREAALAILSNRKILLASLANWLGRRLSSMRVANIITPDPWSGMASSMLSAAKLCRIIQSDWIQIPFFHEVAQIEMIKKSALRLHSAGDHNGRSRRLARKVYRGGF
jgi:hypothetical protein